MVRRATRGPRADEYGEWTRQEHVLLACFRIRSLKAVANCSLRSKRRWIEAAEDTGAPRRPLLRDARDRHFLRAARTSEFPDRPQYRGEFTGGTTVLEARGLTAGEFLAWMETAFADEDVLLAAHPERYAMVDQPDGSVRVVENIGPHVCSFLMGGWGAGETAWAADAAELLPEPDVPHERASNLSLDDGTVVGRVLTQFGDTGEGFSCRLTVYLPASCPDGILDHPRRRACGGSEYGLSTGTDGRRPVRRPSSPYE
ncbi:hypothetical protein AB0J21_24690 [Streptomyces sp. NPDC049954]|uniref:hypothetical protein n=1 Tax=Streptomyces sp. NPDC049954 TaxID=3155779 RepID=UPI00341A7CD5